MKYEILILTMPSRREFLNRLTDNLYGQMEHENFAVSINVCNPNLTLGGNRTILLHDSRGEYVSWIDDDDAVPADFVSTILPLLDGVDYIGFDLQCYMDGVALPKKTTHSLRHSGWFENHLGYFRDISHINPMRRDLAMLEPFEGGHGEDHRWADRMRARGVVKTEHYVPRVLYHYFFRSNKNRANPCPKCGSASTVRVEMGSMCNSCGATFNPHPEQKSCLWE